MKNVIKNLERYYQSFVGQEREWEFFLGLADYVKYVLETPETNKILESIVQKRLNAEKKVKKYERKVIKETKQAKEKLFKVIKNKKISYESLDGQIKEYLEYESGHIQSSQSEAESLNDALQDVIRNLFKSGYKDLVKDFAIGHKEIPNEIGEYTFSKTIDLLISEKEKFNEKMSRELWGDWNYLLLTYLVIFKKEKELVRLNKDKKNFYLAWNFYGLINEMKQIRVGNRLLGTPSSIKPVYFVRDKYKSYASRVHNHLIKELNLRQEVKTDGFNEEVLKTKQFLDKLESDINERARVIEKPAEYKNGILKFRGKEIDFNRKDNQKFLLDALFKEPKKNWFYDELQEIWDEDPNVELVKGYWRKFYTAGDGINNAIAKKTQIEDFIKKNTKQIRINEKYV